MTFLSASPEPFVLTLWTADPAEALAADAAGIHRIGVDLETVGKAERQRGRSTWISPHTTHDLREVAHCLTRATAFARINPLSGDSPDEIAVVLAAGARVLMVPMVASAQDAADVAGLVAGRARLVVLVERREALDGLAAIVATTGVDEIHVGLNDLALSLGLSNRWAALAGSLMHDMSTCVHASGLPFGFGGIGRAFDTTLPIPSDLIYAEYARTGATRALVARSFGVHDGSLATEVPRALGRLAEWCDASPESLAAAHAELGRRVRASGSW